LKGIKWILTTNAAGGLGPVFAVIAVPEMEADDLREVQVPDGHPFGGKLLVFSMKTRSGNDKFWSRLLEEVVGWMETTRERLNTETMLDEWSSQGYVTLDGEYQQIAAVLKPEFLEKCEALKIYFMKHPSACSLIFQANDLMEMHRLLHTYLPQGKNKWDNAGEGTRRFMLNTGRVTLWCDADRPAMGKLEQWAALLAAFRVVGPKACARAIIKKGHDRAGQGDRKLDFAKMAQGSSYTNKLGDLLCMNAWENIAKQMAPKHLEQGELTEADYDAWEPDNKEWATQSQAEIDKRAKGGKERDELCIIQRRAVHLTTPQSRLAREERATKAAAEEAKRVQDELEQESRKVEIRSEKKDKDTADTAKKVEDKEKKLASELFVSELGMAAYSKV
jgi:hypothetical protein